jgi:hypothetical protein
MKNPFPPINYPPGAIDDPNAPWNQVDIVGNCFNCGYFKPAEDMSIAERQSYDDNGDGEFLCDDCEKNWEIHNPED